MMDAKLKQALIDAAISARKNAYAPYSHFKVGAAILTKGGKIYSGANFENASFGAGTCAERVALGSALAAGEREFTAVACVGEGKITPCGICRQALSEFGDMTVICASPDGSDLREYMLSELLPASFSL